MKLNTLCVVGALLISGVGAEDRKQRQRGRGRAPSRRAAAEQAGAEQPVPFWVSGIVGLGLGAAALPLSPVYAAIALGAAQAPGSRMLLSRAARTIRGKLGMAKSLPEGAEEGQVSVSKFARAINKGLVNVVEQLDEVPAFMLVDETGKPLKMTVSEDANDRFSFVYLEYADAKRELSGLRNPDGSEVSQLKVAGTTLGAVVRDYVARKDTNGTDELLVMPSSVEVAVSTDLLSKMKNTADVAIVPNSVPIYQLEGLPSDSELEEGDKPKAPVVRSFFRFVDMQEILRAEALKSKIEAGDAPNLRVRLMRLHEVAMLAGTDRLPGKVVFIPSSSAVKDLAAMKADGQGTPSQGGGSEPSREKEPA